MSALSREPVSGFLVGSAEQNETSNLCHQNHSDLWDNDSKIHLYVYSQWETNTLFFSQFQFGREMFLSASFRPAPFFNSAVTRFLVSHTDAITIILVKFFHFRYIKERGIWLSWPMRSLKQINMDMVKSRVFSKEIRRLLSWSGLRRVELCTCKQSSVPCQTNKLKTRQNLLFCKLV